MSDVSAGMYNACLMLPASLSLLLHLLHIFTFSTFSTYLRFPLIAFLRHTQNIFFHCFTAAIKYLERSLFGEIY